MMARSLTDYATDKVVKDGPEERVRQEFEVLLVDSYGYSKNLLDIEVPIRRGANISDRADIVVYSTATGRVQGSDIVGIIETKKPNDASGADQLRSYMSATSAVWGVLTNGDTTRYFCKPDGGPTIVEGYLSNIPTFGQRIEDVGKLTRADLRPFERTELKRAFRGILNTLYANTNISRREKLGNEMIKLIFAKIQDERTYLDREPQFRAGAGEDADDVKKRITALFERVVVDLAQDGIFDGNDTILLDAPGVAWVVGQLQRGSLLDTPTDVVGDAFEVFAESKLVGEKGEFFTPRGVVELAVALVNPQPRETVCDPACGSGGFLISAMKHIWEAMSEAAEWKGQPDDVFAQNRERMASQCIFGIDKESDLAKIARAYMTISGDGRSNIVADNTLHAVDEYQPQTRLAFVVGDELRQFDCVLTNPPYGTKTKVLKGAASHFDLGHSWSHKRDKWVKGNAQDTDPYVLFVERCFDLLASDGRLAIVLPETVFHGSSKAHLRHYISSRASIEAVIELPHNTFRPHCNAKTCLLIARRGGKQGDVLMAAPEAMGHDHKGNTLYRLDDPETVWDDLPTVISELGDPYDEGNEFVFMEPGHDIAEWPHWMPRYYRHKQTHTVPPEGREWVTLGELLEAGILNVWPGHGSPPAQQKGEGDIPYVRVADIVNWEAYRNPTSGVPEWVYRELTNGKHKPQPRDILFVKRGSYRIGSVAMVSDLDDKLVLTSEILTLRVTEPNEFGITPFYLLALLSSEPVQRQIPSYTFVDTTLPNIGTRWQELQLPIHRDTAQMQRLSTEIEEAVTYKWDAQHKINDVRGSLGHLVT